MNNSRTIKFRAWDDLAKEMVKDDRRFHYEWDNNFNCGYLGTDGDWVECPIMQFTGLLDKNGKEIYHLDICQFDNGDTFIVKLESWLEFYGEWLGEPDCEDQLRDWYRARNSEIIGNIYESPGLMEKK